MFKVGDEVISKKYGTGIVDSITSTIYSSMYPIAVAFKDGGYTVFTEAGQEFLTYKAYGDICLREDSNTDRIAALEAKIQELEEPSTPKLTRDQAAIIGLYTGVACGPFADIQALAEKLLGEPIFTHQFANEKFVDMLKEKVKLLLLEICAEKQ